MSRVSHRFENCVHVGNRSNPHVFHFKEFGYQLKGPWSKVLHNAEGMKELRVKLASNICRLFYFHHKDKLYVVTSGYTKKRDKTDKREIERALRLMHEVLRED